MFKSNLFLMFLVNFKMYIFIVSVLTSLHWLFSPDQINYNFALRMSVLPVVHPFLYICPSTFVHLFVCLYRSVSSWFSYACVCVCVSFQKHENGRWCNTSFCERKTQIGADLITLLNFPSNMEVNLIKVGPIPYTVIPLF
jgi:hypothetical protein